jgi:hypothetical protein
MMVRQMQADLAMLPPIGHRTNIQQTNISRGRRDSSHALGHDLGCIQRHIQHATLRYPKILPDPSLNDMVRILSLQVYIYLCGGVRPLYRGLYSLRWPKEAGSSVEHPSVVSQSRPTRPQFIQCSAGSLPHSDRSNRHDTPQDHMSP